MTVLFYEKQGKALFFLNLISALKLDLFRGEKKKGQIWGQFPVSLKALEKANHMVTQPLVTLCPYLFRFHPGQGFFEITELTSGVSVQHWQRQGDRGFCCLFMEKLAHLPPFPPGSLSSIHFILSIAKIIRGQGWVSPSKNRKYCPCLKIKCAESSQPLQLVSNCVFCQYLLLFCMPLSHAALFWCWSVMLAKLEFNTLLKLINVMVVLSAANSCLIKNK